MHVYALFGYAAFAVLFTWPLAPQIDTHLTGSPAGDTGVYVWNQWVFQREILEQGRFPYFTDKIFSLTGRANLSLHNYTAFQDLVALPLMGWLGVVATFNLVYLLMTVLTGYATFLLAKHVTGRAAESWLAGLLFAWSPIMVTRGGAPVQPRRRGAAGGLPSPPSPHGRTAAGARRAGARRDRLVCREHVTCTTRSTA